MGAQHEDTPTLISAVVLSYNSDRCLAPCLDALLDALKQLPGKSEVAVIDNGSRDLSAQVIRRYQASHPHILKGVFLDRNLGTTVSRNLGLRQSRGRYLLVLDSDVVMPRELLAHLVDALESEPNCGLIAPRLQYPDGRPQISVDRFPTLWRKLARIAFLKTMERKQPECDSNAGPVEVDYAISAFWLLRRELLDEVGYLDERFFYAPEDVDYCLSVWMAGYSVKYDPRVSALHDAQERSRSYRLNAFTRHHLLGLLRYFLKHRYLVSRAGLYRRIQQAQRARGYSQRRFHA